MSTTNQIKVAIIGAGISGLAVANGLLNDPAQRFDVQVYERDSVAFDSERGGYQLRIAQNGLDALRSISDEDLWSALRQTWAGDVSRAPSVVEPKHFEICMHLRDYKAYPASRPVPRSGLRKALLQKLLDQHRVHFNNRLEEFEYIDSGRGGVAIRFDNDRKVTTDILIAADGSGSQVNRQVGLNNKRKLTGLSLIQSRGSVDENTKKSLPKSLVGAGSVIFLGGSVATGFASIYDPESGLEGSKKWNLFWSTLIPQAKGDSMIKKANGDNAILVGLLSDYFRGECGYGEELPTIIAAAKEHVRTGLLTSSVKPTHDWRHGVQGNERVILLGDAVHPMTPGRGMGANQALTDAGQLVVRLRKASFAGSEIDAEELSALVNGFEKEMYERAFKMVKKSEQATELDLTSFVGRLILRCVGIAMTVVGWGITILEVAGLRKVRDLESM